MLVLVASPVIWVAALFGEGGYLANVRRGYEKAIHLWCWLGSG